MFSVSMYPWETEAGDDDDGVEATSNCDFDVHSPAVHSAPNLRRCSACHEMPEADFESFCLRCSLYLPENCQLPDFHEQLTTLSLAYDDCDIPYLGQAK